MGIGLEIFLHDLFGFHPLKKWIIFKFESEKHFFEHWNVTVILRFFNEIQLINKLKNILYLPWNILTKLLERNALLNLFHSLYFSRNIFFLHLPKSKHQIYLLFCICFVRLLLFWSDIFLPILLPRKLTFDQVNYDVDNRNYVIPSWSLFAAKDIFRQEWGQKLQFDSLFGLNMIEVIFRPEFLRIKHIIEVQFCYFFIPAKRKGLRRYVLYKMIFFMKVFNNFKNLNPNHTCIFDSHFSSWAIKFHTIVNW